jgi:hypothetical protein
VRPQAGGTGPRLVNQGSVGYPPRCGHRDPAGWGYLHIRDDSPSSGTIGHGDPINDAAFSAEVAATLACGVEAPQGGSGGSEPR